MNPRLTASLYRYAKTGGLVRIRIAFATELLQFYLNRINVDAASVTSETEMHSTEMTQHKNSNIQFHQTHEYINVN